MYLTGIWWCSPVPPDPLLHANLTLATFDLDESVSIVRFLKVMTFTEPHKVCKACRAALSEGFYVIYL